MDAFIKKIIFWYILFFSIFSWLRPETYQILNNTSGQIDNIQLMFDKGTFYYSSLPVAVSGPSSSMYSSPFCLQAIIVEGQTFLTTKDQLPFCGENQVIVIDVREQKDGTLSVNMYRSESPIPIPLQR